MQKFHHGDHVQIADDLGPMMRHFTSGVDAIVIGSYNDQYGGGDTNSYTLLLKGKGSSSWYYEEQLTLIEKDRVDLIHEWNSEIELDVAKKSDLDWIFTNGKEVIEKGYGASLSELGRQIGINNMWGSRGEGMDLYKNQLAVMAVAKPYLMSGNKEGFLKIASNIKEESDG